MTASSARTPSFERLAWVPIPVLTSYRCRMQGASIDIRRWISNAAVTQEDNRIKPRLLFEILDNTAASAPDSIALEDDRGPVTYAELSALSHQTARFLLGHKVRPRDRVLARGAMRRESMALLYGASRVGAIFVPVSVDARQHVWDAIHSETAPALAIDNEHWECAATEISQASSRVIDHNGETTLDETAIIFFTSGSTGRAKGVVCSHYQVTYTAQAIQYRLNYRPDDTIFLCLPISFDYGCYQLILSTLACARLVLSGYTLGLHMQVLERREITVLPVVPTLAQLLLALSARTSSRAKPRLRLITNTGEALTRSTQDALRETFGPDSLALMYGLTECKRATTHLLGDCDPSIDHVGHPIAGTGVAIVDRMGAAVDTGAAGQIAVFGPHVTDGYWGAPNSDSIRFSACSATGTRVLFTGDTGYLDSDGHLYVLGRADGLFKNRGVRVSAAEIEHAALAAPGVRHAAAVRNLHSSAVVLWVSGEVTPAAVLAAISHELEPARMPTECRVIDQFPRTVHGKVDRNQLRELA